MKYETVNALTMLLFHLNSNFASSLDNEYLAELIEQTAINHRSDVFVKDKVAQEETYKALLSIAQKLRDIVMPV